MPILENPQHELFAQEMAKGASQQEAYKAAGYKGDNPRAIAASASRLLKSANVTARIADLMRQAADRVVLDRSWVLQRLMRNAQIALGEVPVTVSIKHKDEDGNVSYSDMEIINRDAAAANKALELLGKTSEARLFADSSGLPGDDARVIDAQPQALSDDHLRELTKRYASPLKMIEGGKV